MSQIQFKNQKDLVDYMRRTSPGNYRKLSNEDAYNRAKGTLEKKGTFLTDYNPEEFALIPTDKTTLTKYTEEVSPSFVEGLFDLGSKIGLASATEMFTGEEGALFDGLDLPGEQYDVSADFFKQSYNNSSVGLLYQGLYGEKKYDYDIEDYDEINKHWAAEAGSFLTGMLSPVEVGIFFASGGMGSIGSGVTRGAIRAVAPSLFKKYSIEAIKANSRKGLPAFFGNMVAAGIERGMGTGVGLGMFGASHSSLSSAAEQRTQTGKINWEKVMEDGAHGFADSFLLGVPMGLAGAGLGSIYAINKLAQKPMTSLSRNLFGIPGQFTTEAAAFTGLPNLYKEMGVGDYKDYPALFTDDWWAQAGMNTMIIAPLFAYGRVKETWKKNKEAADLADRVTKEESKIAEREMEGVNNLESTMSGFDLPNDLIQEIAKKRSGSAATRSDVERYNTNSKKLIEIIERTEGNISNATDIEIKFMRKEGAQVFLELEGILLNLRDNPNKHRAILKDIKKEKGKEDVISNAELEQAKIKLDEHIEDLQSIFKDMNKNASGRTDEAPNVVPLKEEIPIEGTTSTGVKPTKDFAPLVLERERLIYEEGKPGKETKTVSSEIEYAELIAEGGAPGRPETKWTLREGQVPPGTTGKGKPTRWTYEPIEAEIVNANSSKARPFKDLIEQYDSVKLLNENNKVGLVNAIQSRVAAAKNTMNDAKRALNELDKLLKFTGKTSLGDLNRFDTKNYWESELSRLASEGKTLIIGSNRTSDLNLISASLESMKVIEKAFSNPEISGPYVKKQNIAALTGGRAGGQNLVELNDAVNRIVGDTGKKVKLKWDGKLKLKLMNELQLRDSEINGLQWKHFDDVTGTLNLLKDGAGKGTGLSRFMYLDKPTIDKLKKIKAMSLDQALPNDFIFGDKGAFEITNALKSEAGNPAATSRLLRKLSETKANNAGLNEIEAAIWERLTGHTLYKSNQHKTRVAEIYGNLNNPVEARTLQDAVFNKVLFQGKGVTKAMEKKLKLILPTKRVDYQREAIGTPKDVTQLKEFLREQARLNPGLKINTLKDADFAGRFQAGVIDIVLGKANTKTWYHENAHRLKEMIDRTGNKELQDIWKQAEKLFKKDAKGRDMEEFIADELANWAAGRSVNKGVASKIGSWAGRLWTKIKKVFFGKSNLNKRDVRRLLGEKIYKGFAEGKTPASQSMAMFQYASVKDRAKAVKKNFDDAVTASGEKFSRTDKKILINYIAGKAKLENPSQFKLGNEKMSEADIIAFDKVLNTVPFKKLSGLADIGMRVKLIQNAELMERDFISTDNRRKMLEFFGVKDGNIFSASTRQLKTYQSYLTKAKYPGVESNTAYLYEHQSQMLESIPADFKNITGLKRKLLLISAPTHVVVHKLGLKELSHKLLEHASREADYVGNFGHFEERAKKIMGASWEGRVGKGLKDSLFLLDIPRYSERLNTGDLTKKNKSFMSKAFNNDLLIIKDNQYMPNPNYTKMKEAINLKTKEGQLVKEWVDYTELIVENFKGAARGAFKYESDYMEFLEKAPVKWIENNIYISRIPTKKFMEVFGMGGKYKQKLLQETTNRIAKELAVEKYGVDVTAEQIMKMQSDAVRMAEAIINDMFTFSKSKVSSRFLKKRHDKLPEFITVDGKKIQVYETRYDATVKPYGLGMAKMIANIEIFPEMTDVFKGWNIDGLKGKMRTDALMNKMLENREWGSWLEQQVERQMGVTDSPRGLADDIGRGMEKAATIFAKTALGFPTSGGKNFLLGQSMNVQSFKLRDYFRSLTDIMSADFRKSVRLSGATELGLKNIMSLKTQKFWDKVFRLGGMQPTENMNRYLAVATSKYEQTRLIRTISNPNQSARKIKKAQNRLKDFYFLDKKQIELLEKYGNHGVAGHKFTSSFEKAKITRELKNIQQHMNTYAHINTQGASMNLFQPSWASGRLARPLTLFKRMAYAGSANQLRNFKLAVKNGDLMKIGMMAFAPIASGVALTHLYHAMLGKPLPAQNSNWYEWMKTHLLLGEGLGIVTDILRLLDGDRAEMTVYPALHNWGLSMVDNIRAPIQGKKTIGQSTDDFLRATSSGYRGLMTNLYNRQSELGMGSKKFKNTLNEEFKKENFPNFVDVHEYSYQDLTTRTKFYREFDVAFNNGTEEEAMRQYLVALYSVATDFYGQKVDVNGKHIDTYGAALKSASVEMEKRLKKNNPNPYSFYEDMTDWSPTKQAMSVSFMKWLNKEQIVELASLESMYKTKVTAMKSFLVGTPDKPSILKDPELLKTVKKSLLKARSTSK